MEILDKILLAIHVIFGFTSLATFMVPMFVRKGGDIHRKVGKVYVATMWVVVATAFLLSVINFIAKDYITAIFLGFLTVLTSGPLWYGMSILKYKKEIPESFVIKKKAFEMLIFYLGLLNVAVFFYLKGQGMSILLLVFGIIGMTSAPQAFSSIEKLKSKMNWYTMHLEGLVTAGIAAYTAFFAFGGSNFFASLYHGYWVAVFWIMPSVIGTLTIRYYRIKHEQKQTRVVPQFQ